MSGEHGHDHGAAAMRAGARHIRPFDRADRVRSRLDSAPTSRRSCFGGLILNATVGWWWADPIAALAIAALAINEGREAWQGEACEDCC